MLAQHGIRDEINKLVRYYFDGKEDYRLAAKRAPDPDLQEKLAHYCSQRERMHKEVQELETQMNVEMSDNGHVGADFKRDWERLRGSVVGHGLEAAMKLAHTSDTHALNQATQLTEVGLPEPLQSTLQKHVGELRQALRELESMEQAEHQATT
jgi:uncharacterized protein (TIGR02284 family)